MPGTRAGMSEAALTGRRAAASLIALAATVAACGRIGYDPVLIRADAAPDVPMETMPGDLRDADPVGPETSADVAETSADVAETSADVAETSADVASDGCPPAFRTEDVIADFEGGSPITNPVAGRGGTPFEVISKGTISLAAVDIAPRCGSRRALRISGAGDPGAMVEVRARFRLRAGDPGYFDASGYRGMMFSLRSTAPVRVRFNVPDRHSIVEMCTGCRDHFGLERSAGPEWGTYIANWAELSRQGGDIPLAGLDVSALFGIELKIAAQVAYLEIDDIAFVR